MSIAADHEALFASAPQRSDAPSAEAVVEAIRRTVRRFGRHGPAGRMPQEFGDHPETAAESVSGFVLRHDGSRDPAALIHRQALLGSPGTDGTGIFPR